MMFSYRNFIQNYTPDLSYQQLRTAINILIAEGIIKKKTLQNKRGSIIELVGFSDNSLFNNERIAPVNKPTLTKLG